MLVKPGQWVENPIDPALKFVIIIDPANENKTFVIATDFILNRDFFTLSPKENSCSRGISLM